MVFVSFQYRVGVYGFLASQDIKNDGNLNAGLLDQRAVLLWVQKYISIVCLIYTIHPFQLITFFQFGGDPSQVVLVGASAGSGSIAMHLISYGGTGHPAGESKKPLFVGAIGVSPALPRQLFTSDLEWHFDLILSRTNCTTGRLACLRSLDIAKLQAANLLTAFPGRNANSLLPYSPCVGDNSALSPATQLR